MSHAAAEPSYLVDTGARKGLLAWLTFSYLSPSPFHSSMNCRSSISGL